MADSGKNISILGTIVISLSLFFFKFAEYRPNRVLTGTSIFAREFFGTNFFLLLALSILIILLTSINHKKYKFFIGLILLSLVFLIFFLLGISLARDDFNTIPNGRISLGEGFWLIFLGIEMLITGIFKGENKYIQSKRMFYFFLFIIIFFFLYSGRLNSLSIMKEYFNRKGTFIRQVGRHLSLSIFSVAIALVIGIPTGVKIYKNRQTNSIFLFLINLGQTIPTLSLLGLVMVPLILLSEQNRFLKNLGISGVGFAPAFIVLIIYALFPVVHNTIAGLKMVDPDLIEVATGMGMKNNQIFWKVELPLSLPLVLSGCRIAMTQSIGNTILAGLIGGGGLGSIIFLGLAQAAPDLILLGVIPLVAMAFMMDSLISIFIIYYKKRHFGLTT